MLDAGCGNGWFSARAADMGFEVEGVDFSAEAIDTARRTIGSKVQWHQSELTEFRPGRRYAIVMCIDVLFHVVDDELWEESVRNLASLSAVGGHLLIQEQLTEQRIPIGDHSRTHVRWRVKQDYLDVLPAWRLAEHHKYALPAQGVEKDILLFERSAENGQGD